MTNVSIASTTIGRRGNTVKSLPRKIAERPYEVRIDSVRRASFDDLRDAIGSAKIAKREYPGSLIIVTDALAGQIVIEIEV